MSNRPPVLVNVTYDGTTMTCEPDPVPVEPGSITVIHWKLQSVGAKFKDVRIKGNPKWVTTKVVQDMDMWVTDTHTDHTSDGGFNYCIVFDDSNECRGFGGPGITGPGAPSIQNK